MSVFTHTYRFTLSLSELFILSISLSDSSLIQSLSSVSWTRGARPRGNLLYGQTWLETPDPVRSPKLSNHGRVQYSGGGPPGKRTYCTVPHHISVLPTSEVRTSEGRGGGGQRTWPNSGQSFLSSSKGSTVELVLRLRNLARGLSQIPDYCGVRLLPCGGSAARRRSR